MMARRNCSYGSVGKSDPVASRTIRLKRLTTSFRAATSRSVSLFAPTSSLTASSSRSKRSPGTPSTILPKSWMKRR